MARITKREQANCKWFKAEVGKRLEALGATKDETKTYPYLLDTGIGSLRIAPDLDWVACQWVDLEHVKHTLRDPRLNRCSGKWNHHYDRSLFTSRYTAQAAIDDFFYKLRIFLPAT